jgi:hypothetical protein
MPPKADPKIDGSSAVPVSDDQDLNPNEAALVKFIMRFEERFTKLDTKLDSAMSLFEARSFSDLESLKSPAPDASHDGRSRIAARQSLGSYHSSASSSQELTIRKSSFRLEKPKFEAPKDSKIDGALDEATIKFFDDCDRHIEMWKAMPENIEKTFEGSENFAIVSLPPAVQRKLAHSLEFVFSPAELCMWTEEEIAKAQFWKKVTTSQVRKLILDRKAQGVSLLAAIRTIQPPNIAWSSGVGLIHEEAFQDYKDKLINQVSQIAEGGIFLSMVSIKDAIISAIPDTSFKAELYSKFGHAGSLPGPSAFGQINELSIKSIFEFIHDHIVTIKKKGLAGLVNSRAVSFSTPSTVHKSVGRRPHSNFPARSVQSIDFPNAEFSETNRAFWADSTDRSFWESSDHQKVLSDDEFTSVNTTVQMAQSKDCKHVGIGPDGKLLCPWLGKPDTAKCGFRHPSNELALKGKGVSTSKKVQQLVGLGAGLGISHSDDEDNAEDHNDL